MKATGRMTCSMVKVKKCGLMNLSMRGSISEERSTDLVYMHGLMGLDMKENGMKIKFVVSALTHG